MARRKLVVKDEQVGVQFFDQRLDLFHLAGADVGGRVRALQFLRGLSHHLDPGGQRQLAQLVQAVFNSEQPTVAAQFCSDQKRARGRRLCAYG